MSYSRTEIAALVAIVAVWLGWIAFIEHMPVAQAREVIVDEAEVRLLNATCMMGNLTPNEKHKLALAVRSGIQGPEEIDWLVLGRAAGRCRVDNRRVGHPNAWPTMLSDFEVADEQFRREIMAGTVDRRTLPAVH